MAKQRLSKKITNTPAPWLPGLYSAQAVASAEGLPDVTIYRATVEEALQWKDAAAKKCQFERFLLRHAVDAWDVYDAAGDLESLCDDVVGRRPGEQLTNCVVVSDLLHAEAMAAIRPGIVPIIHVEAHAAASSVDHSNYGFVLKAMVRDADPRDLHHMFVVESHSWDCRVAGIYADVVNLSPVGQDLYLDMLTALKRRVPLDIADYSQLFVNRLAALRAGYLSDVCAAAGKLSGLDADEILSIRMNVGARGAQWRRALAKELLKLTGGKPVAPKQGLAEELDTSSLERISDAVVAAAFKL